MAIKTYKIFLASSSELEDDRNELRKFFSIENDRLHKKGIYFQLVQWEFFLDAISDTRLQDEYNKALEKCDIVLSLFFSKAGNFTVEEFEKALKSFKNTGKPLIYTYFKNAPVNMQDIDELAFLSLSNIKKRLSEIGHFPTYYTDRNDLKIKLKRQLEILIDKLDSTKKIRGDKSFSKVPTTAINYSKESKEKERVNFSQKDRSKKNHIKPNIKKRRRKKPNGYWTFQQLSIDIKKFNQEHNLVGKMPSGAILKKNNMQGLLGAISRFGGMEEVAKKLKLELTYKPVKRVSKSKPKGYWDNIENLRRELLEYMNEKKYKKIPITKFFVKDEKQNILGGIQKHGGVFDVAKKLNLEVQSKKPPRNYWKDFSNFEKEFTVYLDTSNNNGEMPSNKELFEARQHGLIRAIRDYHGGYKEIAKKFNLKFESNKRPLGYWKVFENVKMELEKFILEKGKKGVMPAYRELSDNGGEPIAAAIAKYHGGFPKVAEILSLSPENLRMPQGYWKEKKNVHKKLLEFIQLHGQQGIMPEKRHLTNLGYSSLAGAIIKHGGFPKIAEELDLKYVSKKSPGYWTWETLEKELLEFIEENNLDGRMPTDKEFKEFGKSELIPAIRKFGTPYKIAEKFGLKWE